MPLYYRRNGQTYACYYYNNMSDLNGPGIVDPSTAHLSVRANGSRRYIGLVSCNQTAPYASSHECASHIRVRRGGTIYAVATHSKQVSLDWSGSGESASWYTAPSTSYLPRVSGSGRGAGRSSGGGGAGGGAALAERTSVLFQYTAAASTGGHGRGQGSHATPSMESYSYDLSPGVSYRRTTSTAPYTVSYSRSGGSGHKNHQASGNAIATGSAGASGPASYGGSNSVFGVGTTSFTHVIKTFSGSGALSTSGGLAGGGTRTRTTGSGSTYARATGAAGGSGTGSLNTTRNATTGAVYRDNNANVTIYGAAGAGGNGGNANMRLATSSYANNGSSLSGTTTRGSHGSISFTITYWDRGN